MRQGAARARAPKRRPAFSLGTAATLPAPAGVIALRPGLLRHRWICYPLLLAGGTPWPPFFPPLFLSALVTYLFCDWFNSSFVAYFVTILLLLPLDFWSVKDLTGRLLIGLHLWNQIDQDGKSHWVFETEKVSTVAVSTEVEAQIFWLGLIICPVIWTVFFFLTLFSFKLK